MSLVINKDHEVYSDIAVPRGFFFVRLDGWNFHSLTDLLGLGKPYDKFLAECLVEVADEFFKLFDAKLAYIFSDEISLLFPEEFSLFDRRIEKIDSVFSGVASSTLQRLLSQKYVAIEAFNVAFDCRITPLTGGYNVLDYLDWRQSEAYRNCSNAYAFRILVDKEKLKPSEATEKLNKLKARELRKLIEDHGIKFSEIPAWHSKGILIQWETYEKQGFDPTTDENVLAKRRRISVNWTPPNFNSEPGKNFLTEIVKQDPHRKK
ncbi:MAG: tRNA(His) guanylyltransferase Thg1 family protein [Candidatus Atabeyarchaeum deiterrae]